MSTNTQIRRSWLYVPGHREKYIRKALDLRPDVVTLDLEDSVPADEKEAARANLRDAHAALTERGHTVFVRVNAPRGDLEADLSACVSIGALKVLLPKVEDSEQVAYCAGRLREASAEHTGFDPELALTIESPLGVLKAYELATADSLVSTLIAGAEDLAWEMGVEPTEHGSELRTAKSLVLIAAKAAGVFPSGLFGSLRYYDDPDANERLARDAYQHGFRGASCIHPDQIAAFNRGFSPSEDEVAAARALVLAYEQRAPQGGAVAVGGTMVDRPVLERARAIMELGEREQGKR